MRQLLRSTVLCSAPWIVTAPVAMVAGAPGLLCSFPVNVSEPVPGVEVVADFVCSVPVIVSPPLAAVPAAPPPGSSTSINRPKASLMLSLCLPVSSVKVTVVGSL